jgi:hypothetical protein
LRVAIIARASFNAWVVHSISLTWFGVYRIHFLPPFVDMCHTWLLKSGLRWQDQNYSEICPELKRRLRVRHKAHCVAHV